MKIRKILVGLLAFSFLSVASTAFAEDDKKSDKSKDKSKTESYQLDPAHTSAVFRATHLGIGHQFGRFNDVSGKFKWNEDNPEKNSVMISINTASVDTNQKKRDKHLRSPDFFNAKQFPKMTFKSDSFEKTGDNTYKVTGKLKMHGKTNKVSFELKHNGTAKGPQGKFRRGVYAEFTINRMEYGVDYMPDGLSKEIKVMFAAEGIRK